MATSPEFEKLLESVSIGDVRLKNRIFMPPMGDRYSRDGFVTEQQKDYYAARAKGGAGLIIVAWGHVDAELGRWGGGPQLALDDDKFIPGLKELAWAIKRHGARAAIQIGHVGGRTQAHLQPVGPSSVPHFNYKAPRALTVAEIKGIVRLFVRAAGRAKESGFDGVELHAAHGFLLSEFLSPVWNKREDEYGGSLKNRTRFLVELVRAIKMKLGQSYPIWCRLNCEEPGWVGGITPSEAQAIARILQDAGVDAIHISKDTQVLTGMPAFHPSGFMLPMANAIKKAVSVPVLVAGWVSPQLGEKSLRERKADLIGFGRALIADPELPNKLQSGEVEDIVPCIRCYRCQGDRKTWDLVDSAGGIRCSVNAAVGRERECEITPAIKGQTVLVVGGGPAGMEAARVAALRGHAVMLYDANARLGGQLLWASMPPLKETLHAFRDYLVTQLTKLGVRIQLGEEVTSELVASMRPDVIILATGARPIVPEIPKGDGGTLAAAESALDGKINVGTKVVVLGGGMTGAETAEWLADQGKHVTIVEV